MAEALTSTTSRYNYNGAVLVRRSVWVDLLTLILLAVCFSLIACSSGSSTVLSTESPADDERRNRAELADDSPSRRVTDLLEELPTEPRFYVVLGALIVGLALRHWFLQRSLSRSLGHHKDDENSNLSRVDWWVIQELRQRALRLRARANWILLLVCALLLGGLYVVFFVLSHVLENERIQEERLRSELFKARFGDELEALVRGRHWVRVDGASLEAAEEVREDATTAVQLRDGQIRPRGRWSSRALSGNGSTGLVADTAGPVFLTQDSGNQWVVKGIELELGEWVAHAAFSTNGDVGLLAGDVGSVLTTDDKGSSWSLRPEVRLGFTSVVALSGDGSVGLVADRDGRVFVRRDSGEVWMEAQVDLSPTEWVEHAAFSTNGRVGLLAGDEGSVSTTDDRGESWELRPVVGLGFASAAALSGDGLVGLLADRLGRAFMTSDSGETWAQADIELRPGDFVEHASLSTNGQTGLVVGIEGSVLATGDSGNSWTPWEPAGLGPVTAATLSADGSVGLVADRAGRVFVTRDLGGDWASVDIELSPGDFVDHAFLSADGDVGLIVGREGSLLTTDDGAASWMPAQAKLPLLATDADGSKAIVRDYEGHLFITHDAGEEWRPLPFTLSGRLRATAIDTAGTVAFVADDRGVAHVSWDGGRSWQPTDAPDGEVEIVFLTSPTRLLANVRKLPFGLGSVDGQFSLERHSALEGWQMKSSNTILSAMRESASLENSEIHRSMRQFLRNYDTRSLSEEQGPLSAAAAGENAENLSGDNTFTDLRIIQAATLTILFFLVQTLTRLHRYSLRLAAFWESRADSVLLAQDVSKVKFEDLVRSLAPDTYDFRSSARSPLRSLLSRGKG